MFRAHPESQSLFPNFANAPINSLAKNPEFLAYGNMLTAGLDFMIDNLADTKIISQMLVGKPWQSYFSPNVSITQQLEVWSLQFDSIFMLASLIFYYFIAGDWSRLLGGIGRGDGCRWCSFSSTIPRDLDQSFGSFECCSGRQLSLSAFSTVKACTESNFTS